MADKELDFNIKSNIKGVAKDAEKLGDSLETAGKQTEKISKTAGKGAKGFGLLRGAVNKVGTALKGLGIIAVLAAAFNALKEALGRNQKVMNTVNTVMTAVSTTFNQVIDVLVDVYGWVTKSSDRFDGLTKVISGLMTIALTPLKMSFYAIKLAVQGAMLAWEDSFLGGGDEKKMAELREDIKATKEDILDVGLAAIDAGKDVYNNTRDAIGEIAAIGEQAVKGISEISIKANIEQAKATTAAQNNSKLAEAGIQGLIEKYDRQAELQRQIRDDETKTFAERIAANTKLGEILDEQEAEMLKLADTRVASAALELSANKENIELQVAYQQALNDRAGVEAQVAGFRSEQLTNEVALEKELGEVKNELLLEGLDGIARELAELEQAYELKVKMAKKAGIDTAAITAQYERQKADIVKSNQEDIVKWSEMSSEQQLGMASQTAGNMAKILGEETEAGKAMAIVQATIDTYKSAQAAYASMAGILYVGPVLGAIAAAAAVAAGLKNIAAIKSASSSGPSGGGGAPSSAPSMPSTTVASGAFTLGEGVEPEPARAYVVSDDITNNQNKLANIRRRATI